MPPSEVKMLNFIAHLINSSRFTPRLPLPCLPDCNSHLMLSSRLPKIYAGGLSLNSIPSDIAPQTFIALLYAVVPVLIVFIKWDVGAFFITVGCSLVRSSLLTVSVTQKENKSIDYLWKDTLEAVRFLSFPCCLHVWKFMVFSCFSIVFEWLVVPWESAWKSPLSS